MAAIPLSFRLWRTGDDGQEVRQEARLVRVERDAGGEGGASAGGASGSDGVGDVVATHTELIDVRNPYAALLRLDEPLVEGAAYAVEAVACGATELSAIAHFTAGPSIELPETLGVVSLTGPSFAEMQLLAGGTYSCGNVVSGQFAEASVKLFPSVAAWAPLLEYSATVDGEFAYDETWGALGGSPPPGPGGIRLYRLCNEASVSMEHQGLAAGRHEVVFHATLPGTSVALETEPVAFELYCDGETPQAPDGGGAGRPGSVDGGAGKPGSVDGGAGQSGEVDGNAGESGDAHRASKTRVVRSGGCGVVTHGAPDYSLLALGAALLAFTRRRRGP